MIAIATARPPAARRARTLVLCLALAAGLAACGNDKSVGEGLGDGKKGGGNVLDTTTTIAGATTLPPPTTAALNTTAAPTTAAAVATTAPKATTTTRPAATTTTIPIVQASIGASAFEPQNLRVFVNQSFTYTNKDSSPRGVKAKHGAFASPSLAPGASWTFKIPQAGSFDIVDSTRPFVVGSIIVVAR